MDKSLSIDKIIDVFTALSGGDCKDPEIYCNPSKAAVEANILPDCDVQANMISLCYAAGCMAYYKYTLRTVRERIPNFKAGDITVSDNSDSVLESARLLMLDAIKDISHLMRSKRFSFSSVKA